MIAVLAAVAAYTSWRAQREDRNLLALAARDRTRLEAAIQRAAERAAAADRAQRPRRAARSNRQGTNQPAPKPKGIAPANLGLAILNDPKFQALYFAAQRPKLLLRYGALFQKLGLTSAQTDQFVQNMVKRDEASLDLAATARAQRLPPEDPSLAALRQQAAGDYQAVQTALLGAAGYSQADAFERSVPIRNIVDSVAGQLALSGEPLTVQQADQMVEAAAGASAAFKQGKSAGPGTVDWGAALAQVQTEAILSASQLAAYTAAVNSAQVLPRIVGLLPKAPENP